MELFTYGRTDHHLANKEKASATYLRMRSPHPSCLVSSDQPSVCMLVGHYPKRACRPQASPLLESYVVTRLLLWLADGVLKLFGFAIFFSFFAMDQVSDYWQTVILVAGGVWLLLWFLLTATKQAIGAR
jgi:hypothetical protein